MLLLNLSAIFSSAKKAFSIPGTVVYFKLLKKKLVGSASLIFPYCSQVWKVSESLPPGGGVARPHAVPRGEAAFRVWGVRTELRPPRRSSGPHEGGRFCPMFVLSKLTTRQGRTIQDSYLELLESIVLFSGAGGEGGCWWTKIVKSTTPSADCTLDKNWAVPVFKTVPM